MSQTHIYFSTNPETINIRIYKQGNTTVTRTLVRRDKQTKFPLETSADELLEKKNIRNL